MTKAQKAVQEEKVNKVQEQQVEVQHIQQGYADYGFLLNKVDKLKIIYGTNHNNNRLRVKKAEIIVNTRDNKEEDAHRNVLVRYTFGYHDTQVSILTGTTSHHTKYTTRTKTMERGLTVLRNRAVQDEARAIYYSLHSKGLEYLLSLLETLDGLILDKKHYSTQNKPEIIINIDRLSRVTTAIQILHNDAKLILLEVAGTTSLTYIQSSKAVPEVYHTTDVKEVSQLCKRFISNPVTQLFIHKG